MVRKSNAKVYFRILPQEDMDWNFLKILQDRKTIYIRYLQELSKTYNPEKPKTYWRFETDGVFYNDPQERVYNEIISEIIETVTQGENKDAIIMAYGQTGTGKSLTINGLQTSYEHRGILPRIIPEIFANKKSPLKKNTKMCIQISYIEITRSPFLKDLLQAHPRNQINCLKDISLIKVKSEGEALEYLFRGEGRKDSNEDFGYFSHSASSIFTFTITTKNSELENPSRNVSKLHVIDLAGAGTVGNFSCLFKEPWEIGNGNLAKTQLEQFILVLTNRDPDLIKVKQRLNFIIQYLGSALSTSNLLRFIGHIRTNRDSLLVTISMLRFGQIVSGLRPSKYDDIASSNQYNVRNLDFLMKELKDLKAENTYKNILLNNDFGVNLNQDRFAHVKRTAAEYLQNKTTEMALMNVSEVKVAMEAFKQLSHECEEEKKTLINSQLQVEKSRRSSSVNLNKRDSKQVVRKNSSTGGKKSIDNSASLIRSRSSTVNSVNKIPKAKSDTSRMKSSNISLMKKSSTSRRKSSSSASVFTDRSKLKSRSDWKLMAEMIPEYKEAWNSYLIEKQEDYRNFLDLYEKNESSARIAHKDYLREVELLQEKLSSIEEMENNVFLAGMTKKYQQIELLDDEDNVIESEIEIKLKDILKNLQENKTDMQESVLRHQAELKMCVNICRDVKAELKKQFDEFCKQKYQLPVENLESEECCITILEKLCVPEEDKNVSSIMKKTSREPILKINFEKFKRLIDFEKQKIISYNAKQRDWVKSFKKL